MKKEKDETMRNFYDTKQTTIKLIMNSLYGT